MLNKLFGLKPSSKAKPKPQAVNKYKLVIGNTAKRASEKTFVWSCYVEEPFEGLIEKVVFTLHPTFKDPVITVSSPPFQIDKVGWGTFEIGIQVHFKNAKTSMFSHDLSFSQEFTQTEYEVELPAVSAPLPKLLSPVNSTTIAPGDVSKMGAWRPLASDVMVIIFSYCGFEQALRTQLVNRYTYELLQTPTLWRAFISMFASPDELLTPVPNLKAHFVDLMSCKSEVVGVHTIEPPQMSCEVEEGPPVYSTPFAYSKLRVLPMRALSDGYLLNMAGDYIYSLTASDEMPHVALNRAHLPTELVVDNETIQLGNIRMIHSTDTLVFSSGVVAFLLEGENCGWSGTKIGSYCFVTSFMQASIKKVKKSTVLTTDGMLFVEGKRQLETEDIVDVEFNRNSHCFAVTKTGKVFRMKKTNPFRSTTSTTKEQFKQLKGTESLNVSKVYAYSNTIALLLTDEKSVRVSVSDYNSSPSTSAVKFQALSNTEPIKDILVYYGMVVLSTKSNEVHVHYKPSSYGMFGDGEPTWSCTSKFRVKGKLVALGVSNGLTFLVSNPSLPTLKLKLDQHATCRVCHKAFTLDANPYGNCVRQAHTGHMVQHKTTYYSCCRGNKKGCVVAAHECEELDKMNKAIAEAVRPAKQVVELYHNPQEYY